MANTNYTSINDRELSYIEVPEYNDKELVGGDDYVKNVFRSPVKRSLNYVKGLFPFMEWFPHYPSHPDWILSDFITGVTVAIVLVPQSMSYAKLAELSPEYGLYSAFIGVFFYFIFATSREICIGPVAVLSTEVGKIVTRVQAKYGDEFTANEIATTLALISGGIVLGIGLLRLGFIVELISLPAILAFTTGSAFNIVTGQLAGLMGYKNKVKKEDTTYLTMIQFLKHLPDTKVDAAYGLVGLFILYLWQFVLNKLIERNKHNTRRKMAFIYLLNLRTAFVIIISTCISYGILRYHPKKEKPPYSIIGVIPSGLRHVGRFVPKPTLAAKLASDIPISTIVLVLEHISISKSFARINGYRVNPNQEFIAIGFTNMVGTFFNAYPVTGSFSRTALSAKCGVKTPFKSAFSGGCVLLAIYCFTGGFYYIPNATLCAIIIHCVTGLLASYDLTAKLYMFSPVDFVIFIVGVFITVFASIEDGIYWAICASCATVLWRMLLPNGAFLGRVKVATIRNPLLVKNARPQNSEQQTDLDSAIEEAKGDSNSIQQLKNDNADVTSFVKTTEVETTVSISSLTSYQYKWVPLPNNASNPSFVHTRYVNAQINVEDPPSGILVYRVSENFIYTNCSLQIDQIISQVRDTMRPYKSDRERLWCEYTWEEKNWDFNFKKFTKFKGLKRLLRNRSEELDVELDTSSSIIRADEADDGTLKPKLRILHLDFSQVVAVDSTSVQALLDLRKTINDYCGPDWEMHFSGIINPWVIRGLLNAGFGDNSPDKADDLVDEYLKEEFRSIPLWKKRVADVDDDSEFDEETGSQKVVAHGGDLEVGIAEDGKMYPIFSTNHPNFHVDIPSYTEYS